MKLYKKGISAAWFWDPVICEAKQGAGNHHGIYVNASSFPPCVLGSVDTYY